MDKTRSAIGAISLAALLTLTACGDDSAGGDGTATESTSDAPAAPGGFDSGRLEEIQACLEAAGLEDRMPTGQPNGMPTDLPSDFPTDMPTDMPTEMSNGFGSGGPGGALGALQDPEVQEALEACGIELPQAPDQS